MPAALRQRMAQPGSARGDAVGAAALRRALKLPALARAAQSAAALAAEPIAAAARDAAHSGATAWVVLMDVDPEVLPPASITGSRQHSFRPPGQHTQAAQHSTSCKWSQQLWQAHPVVLMQKSMHLKCE